LGIETSCDETAAAVVDDGRDVLSSVVSSQVDLHARFGGVVPEIASRAHVELVNPVIAQALVEAGTDLDEIDAVAACHGPGLAGALLVGVSAAKAIALVADVPYIGVNHLEAHLHAAWLEQPDLQVPAAVLVVSGGHTMVVAMDEIDSYRVLGQTVDDAAGEAFDKVARFLGLGYPGGPVIDRLAVTGDPDAIAFPRPMRDEESQDRSREPPAPSSRRGRGRRRRVVPGSCRRRARHQAGRGCGRLPCEDDGHRRRSRSQHPATDTGARRGDGDRT
jgi:N6-L-threonylcarbamoyladenine synthase